MFERFTERARQAIVLAQDEARALKHGSIGPEHILLGLLGVREGLAARVLHSFDLTGEEVRARVARVVGQGDEVRTGQIPFTPSAKKTLELGLREALALGHNYVGTEHLLLAVARIEDEVVAPIMRDFDLDAEKVRDEVIRMVSSADRPSEIPGDALVDLDAISVALEEAKQRLIEEKEYEAAAGLRDRQRQLVRLVREIEAELARFGEARTATPFGLAAREYDVKTLDGASDTWAAQLAEGHGEGWELLSVVHEGGAVRAILERRRRAASA